MSESLEEIQARTAGLREYTDGLNKKIIAMEDRLAHLEGEGTTKFLADKTVPGDWLPADATAFVPIVVDLIYFMYRECRKWPTVEQVVAQLQRDQRLNESRARQVLGHALSVAEPLRLDPDCDSWLVKIDREAHDDLEDSYQDAHRAWQYTEYPPERIR
jgi:hypothetical protein